MSKDLTPILESIGFDAKQSQLYLAGLILGSAPASEYAKETGFNRITTYNSLEELVHLGHFTMEKRIRAKWYAPLAPEYLAVEARKNATAFERALPELRSLQGAAQRSPHVRFFEGWEGVRHVYDDTLTAQSELLNFANSAIVRKFWPGYDEEYVAERVKRGVRLRGIAPDDATGRKVHGEDQEKLREIRLVRAADFDFTNEINIYDYKVAICSFGVPACPERGPKGPLWGRRAGPAPSDMFGVIIESKEVAETQRQIFEMAWRYAGRKTRRT